MDLRHRLYAHDAVQDLDERARSAFLRRPPAANPPELMKPTRCRVLRPFCVAGKRVEPGQTVELARHDAESMKAIGRVEVLA